MLLGLQSAELQLLALGHQRELVLQLLVFFVFGILAFFIDFQEAIELGHRTRRAKQILVARFAFRGHIDGGLIEHRRIHLRRHKAHPDQPVQLQLIFLQQRRDVVRRAHRRRGTNGFVGVLRFLLGLVDGRSGRQILGTEFSVDVLAHFGQSLVGNAGRVGTHVGNQTGETFISQFDAFVQALRQAHGTLHAEPQLASGFLL